MSMTFEQLSDLAVAALEELKALNVRVLDVREQTNITEIMIIATGSSGRQVKALADNVVKRAKERGAVPLGIEGDTLGEWFLVDLNDVVVHVMQPAIREFYQLEKLWSIPPSTTTNAGD